MIGTTELIIIFLIIIVVFGSTKLPQLGDALGKSIKNFKSAIGDADKENKTEKNTENTDEDSNNNNQ